MWKAATAMVSVQWGTFNSYSSFRIFIFMVAVLRGLVTMKDADHREDGLITEVAKRPHLAWGFCQWGICKFLFSRTCSAGQRGVGFEGSHCLIYRHHFRFYRREDLSIGLYTFHLHKKNEGGGERRGVSGSRRPQESTLFKVGFQFITTFHRLWQRLWPPS